MPGGRASASISTRSARCIPNVAFQPAEVGHLDRRDRRPVMAEVVGTVADTRSPFLHRRLQSDPLQMPHAVGGQKHAGADLADRGCLLVDLNPHALGDQRIGCEQAADPASDDHDIQTGLHHSTPCHKRLKAGLRGCILTQSKAFCHQARSNRGKIGGGFHVRRVHPAFGPGRPIPRPHWRSCCVLSAPSATPARAEDYPDRPVKIIVPFAAGGTADAMPRLVADWLSRKWGQPVDHREPHRSGGKHRRRLRLSRGSRRLHAAFVAAAAAGDQPKSLSATSASTRRNSNRSS